MAKPPVTEQDQLDLGKVCRMVVQNFRAIGPNPVVVDLDSIVVLVGPNNTGKSSILRAYEVAMLDGSKTGHLDKEDFPNGDVLSENHPTIELQTEVIGNPPAKKWITEIDGKRIVRERWVWEQPGAGKRQGWNVELPDGGGWDEQHKPWGYTAVANARRPQPHAVRAFDSPEEQAKQINSLVVTLVQDRALGLPATDGSGDSEFSQISKRLKDFQDKVVSHAKVDLEEIEGKLTAMIAEIFANHVVTFEPMPSSFETFKLFASSKMLVGHKDGHRSPLELQGSGARRTLLWSVLRIVSESAKGQGRPHLLLIDEPELCLHPSAVREACRVLYDLADKAGWQVMVTTHHPAFIDLARDNKTIVRVERTIEGDINGTTLFKPSVANLSDDDKQNLKLLNIFDPYVAEFFFGGCVIVVEGDTEYSAFRYTKDVGDCISVPSLGEHGDRDYAPD
jgi:putative ATP-dependent endonuclease of OLD family